VRGTETEAEVAFSIATINGDDPRTHDAGVLDWKRSARTHAKQAALRRASCHGAHQRDD
jgi:hypothetical protein